MLYATNPMPFTPSTVRAYVGSFFPGVVKWRYVEHEPGIYPFQPAVDLWRLGLVASYDGTTWRLHGHEDARVLWEGGSDGCGT